MNKNHHKDYPTFKKLWTGVEELQTLASLHGIDDIFQDNGGKLLQTLLILNLKDIPGREGNDAFDDDGNQFELKSVNMNLTYHVSTHHHMNPDIIKKYKSVEWIFSIYSGINLEAIYKLSPSDLFPLFELWEEKCIREDRELNNPKIPLKLIIQKGELLFGEDVVLLRKPINKVNKPHMKIPEQKFKSIEAKKVDEIFDY